MADLIEASVEFVKRWNLLEKYGNDIPFGNDILLRITNELEKMQEAKKIEGKYDYSKAIDMGACAIARCDYLLRYLNAKDIAFSKILWEWNEYIKCSNSEILTPAPLPFLKEKLLEKIDSLFDNKAVKVETNPFFSAKIDSKILNKSVLIILSKIMRQLHELLFDDGDVFNNMPEKTGILEHVNSILRLLDDEFLDRLKFSKYGKHESKRIFQLKDVRVM